MAIGQLTKQQNYTFYAAHFDFTTAQNCTLKYALTSNAIDANLARPTVAIR